MTTTDRKTQVKRTRPASQPARSSAREAADDLIQRAIGEQLKAEFDAVAQQPVPDRFTELLRRLEEQERQKK
ncbi:MAG: anti-sigma factor [Alphaproteobacteria bacterium]|nr:anti-sigma factor [Alphaproteobacteria bacterium]